MTGCIVYLGLSAFAGFGAYAWALGKNLPESQAQLMGVFAAVAVLILLGMIYKWLTTPSTSPSGTPPPRMNWNPNTNRREPVQEPCYYPEPVYISESGGTATANRGTITARQPVGGAWHSWQRNNANIGQDEYDRLRDAERKLTLRDAEERIFREGYREEPATRQHEGYRATWIESKYPNGHDQPPVRVSDPIEHFQAISPKDPCPACHGTRGGHTGRECGCVNVETYTFQPKEGDIEIAELHGRHLPPIDLG